MALTLHSALLCDQVRREDNGKYFAIGIYSHSIVFGAFPATYQFYLFSRVTIDGAGKHLLRIRVLVGGQENHIVEGGTETEAASEDWLAIPLQPIQFQVPTSLSFEQFNEAGKATEFFRINVIRAPSSLPPSS